MPHLRIWRWLLIGLGLLPMLGCAVWPNEAEKQMFEFSSGGAYHPQGYGEWHIKVDAAGKLAVAHNVQGDITRYGPFSLTEKENADLWQLVQAADLQGMSPPQRSGLPDEAQYTFTLKNDTGDNELKMWVGDAQQDDKIMTLVDGLAMLIKKYTGQAPVLG